MAQVREFDPGFPQLRFPGADKPNKMSRRTSPNALARYVAELTESARADLMEALPLARSASLVLDPLPARCERRSDAIARASPTGLVRRGHGVADVLRYRDIDPWLAVVSSDVAEAHDVVRRLRADSDP